jgi:dihydroorotate dehydrogenase
MSLFDNIIRPLLFNLPAETAHELAINSLRYGFSSEFLQKKIASKFECHDFGDLNRFGLTFKNPFGIAAGFDKNAVVANQLAALGFGFIEIGTTTFHPQPGNPQPRLFRLPEDSALVNRAGFNNEGTKAAVERLKISRPDCVLGFNIGKNKDVSNDDAIENYLASFNLACEVADYVAVNVSSPNTPNLRELQKAESLEELLKTVQNNNLKKIPLLVKIAPDLSEAEIESIVDICLRLELSGIIATNTTVSRENLKTQNIGQFGQGGLSGKPLAKRSTEVIATIYKHSKGKLPIIGVGGIFTAEDAFAKICAGASLLQAYTGFVYRGIGFAHEINCGIAKLIKEKGFETLDIAVGSDVK